jgi:hypothetical protein
MIPNSERPDREQQEFIVRAINTLGFNPVDKPFRSKECMCYEKESTVDEN